MEFERIEKSESVSPLQIIVWITAEGVKTASLEINLPWLECCFRATDELQEGLTNIFLFVDVRVIWQEYIY